jgi:gas vesicle protein
MSDSSSGTAANAALLFLAGAAVGALAIALTTPRSGPELRDDLKLLGRRIKGLGKELRAEAEDAWNERKDQNAGERVRMT